MKIQHLLCYLILGSPCFSRKAIVTLLSGSVAEAERYVRLLHFFVYSLRNAGYKGEVAVMYAKDFPIEPATLSKLLNVRMIPVDKIKILKVGPRMNAHYSSMLTKLHLWSLTEYDQIIYYDCDFIFQGNPESAFGQCSWSSLCATPDTGISDFNKAIRPGTYFNGGFLVLRPNEKRYKFLLANKHQAEGKFFVEQDLLNRLYKGKWGALDQSYNLMHCYREKNISSQVIAIHEKMWILRKNFPESQYVWNSSKMKIQYPVSNVLTIAPAQPQVQKEESTKRQRLPPSRKQPVAYLREEINDTVDVGGGQSLNSTAAVAVTAIPPAQLTGTALSTITNVSPTDAARNARGNVRPVEHENANNALTQQNMRHRSQKYAASINRAPSVRTSRTSTKNSKNSLRASQPRKMQLSATPGDTIDTGQRASRIVDNVSRFLRSS